MLLSLTLACLQSSPAPVQAAAGAGRVEQASDEYSDLEALDEGGLFRLLWFVRTALERKLLVPDPELVAALAPVPEGRLGGVFKLVDNRWIEELEGQDSLTRIESGGSYYSYRKDSHEYNDTPILRLDRGELSGYCWGGHLGFVAPLGKPGELELDQIPTQPGPLPQSLDQASQAAWELAWAAEDLVQDPSSPTATQWAALQKARPAVEVGQVYVHRSFLRNEPGQLVALQVIAQDARTCTIAWRGLATWPEPGGQSPSGRRIPSPLVALGPGPPRIQESSIEELVELRRQIQERGKVLLTEDIDTDNPLAQALLHGDSGPGSDRPGGALRCLDASEWGVLVSYRVWTNQHYSLLSGKHTWHSGADFQIYGRRLMAASNSRGGRLLPLGRLRPRTLQALVADPQKAKLLPGQRPAWDALMSVPALRVDDSATLDKDHETALIEHGVVTTALLSVGHSYLLRTVLHPERDNAYLLTVSSEDDYGIVVTWRLLERFPLE